MIASTSGPQPHFTMGNSLPQAIIGIPVQHTTGDWTRFSVGVAYCRAVEMAQGVPLLIPLARDHRMLSELLARCDGLLLAGGGDVSAECYGAEDSEYVRRVDQLRDRVEIRLVQQALGRIPILAICRGIQVLNVAAGGTLIQDIAAVIGPELDHQTPSPLPPSTLRHKVVVMPGSLLAESLAIDGSGAHCVRVNSTHHQAVQEIAPCFRQSAVAPDGVVEAIESVDSDVFTLGVQWHPERLVPDNASMVSLFARFVRASAL